VTDDDRMMDLAAEIPPPIVEREPRYQQVTGSPFDHHAGRAAIQQEVTDLQVARPDLDLSGLQSADVERCRRPIWHLDGVSWVDVEPPHRDHKHWPQTVGCTGVFDETWRCPCGAFADPYRGGRWVLIDKPRVTGLPVVPAARPSMDSRWRRILAANVVAVLDAVAASFLWTWLFGPDVSVALSLVSALVIGLVIGCGAISIGRRA
jgi:hypothetical protein